MKTEKLKLTKPQFSKLYSQGKPYVGFSTESLTTDPTTTCTTSNTTTHIYKV